MTDVRTALLRLVRNGNDLTARQLLALILCGEEPRTIRGLAETLNVSKPAITRAVDRLAEANYVKRADDPNDRRSVLVNITAAGRKFVEKLLED